jgi:uncharacterized protein YbjT (DUF2867 family)
MKAQTIFVTGATGAQGGAVARALLRNHWVVHALVRDPTSEASQRLQSQGAILFTGDWDDLPALEAAAAGCNGLFLNCTINFEDLNAEVRHAQNILKASKVAGIGHVVYSSAMFVDEFDIESTSVDFLRQYFIRKREIEQEVQNGGWQTWTILRGGNFMSNYLLPVASFMFPQLVSEGRLVTAYIPETKVLLVHPEDIGAFGFAAFSEPKRFGGKGITVVAEALTLQNMADQMEKVSGKKVHVTFLSEEEVEAGTATNPIWASQQALRQMHTWLNVQDIEAWGIPMLKFEQFLEQQRECLSRTIGGS